MPPCYRRFLALLLVALLALGLPRVTYAARGEPGSADFGVGATLHLDGPSLDQAMQEAVDLKLDWIAVPLVWESVQPQQGQPPQWQALDRLMQAAQANDIAVMVSLTGAPAWARSRSGPNPGMTADLLLAMVRRYPHALRAVELFAGANTVEGWGAAPDPRAYAAFYQSVGVVLSEQKATLLLVAGGLRLLPPSPSKGDMDDLQFLEGLYAAGAASFMPVISLQLDSLTGAPADFPQSKDLRVLRHYEVVRRVMAKNHHQNSLIWITRLSPPSGTIEGSDSIYQSANMQSSWLSLALIQLRSQLYIGVTIIQSLNSDAGGQSAASPAMIDARGERHPFYTVLLEMIRLNRTGSVTIVPGKPKEGFLGKKRP